MNFTKNLLLTGPTLALSVTFSALANAQDCDQGFINTNALADSLARTPAEEWNTELLGQLTGRTRDALYKSLKKATDNEQRQVERALKTISKRKDKYTEEKIAQQFAGKLDKDYVAILQKLAAEEIDDQAAQQETSDHFLEKSTTISQSIADVDKSEPLCATVTAPAPVLAR
ncbi:MAG: hypothetical protein H6868_09000 [Rhodospirillales bacterium]|nr:hypothetical protein [Rhodospirillales bacterium]